MADQNKNQDNQQTNNYQMANDNVVNSSPSVNPINQHDTTQPPYQPSPAREKFEQTIMPTQNKPAILAYYFGFAGFFPFIGLPFTYLAIKYGHRALKQYKEKPTPGAKAHAKIGLYLAYFELTVFILFIAIMIYFYLTRPDKSMYRL